MSRDRKEQTKGQVVFVEMIKMCPREREREIETIIIFPAHNFLFRVSPVKEDSRARVDQSGLPVLGAKNLL